MEPALSHSEHFAALTDPAPPGSPSPSSAGPAPSRRVRPRTRLPHHARLHPSQDPLVKATLSKLLRRLDIEAIEQILAAWVASRLAPAEAREIALDGKTLRGSADGPLPSLHLLAAYAPDVGAMLRQLRVAAKSNQHEEARKTLGVLPLSGCVMTAYAMFTHADFAAEVITGAGDSILPVKDNQPRLLSDIAYGITSLSHDKADAARLLGLVRRRWVVKNRLHHVRDVRLGKDTRRVRWGSVPTPQHLNAKPRKAIKLLQSKRKN